jgi:hypothetical protein
MLRIIAFTTMAIDHIGAIFFPQFIIFRIIGRVAMPLFAFSIAEGYNRTRDVNKYGQRILLLALISQLIFFLLFNNDKLNICFTLFLGLASIYIYDKAKNWFIKTSGILLLLIVSIFFNLEYGAYGILMILFFHIFRNNTYLLIVQSLLILAFVLTDFNQIINIFAILAIFLAHFFKKYDFRLNRIVQYWFYPVHLLLIYLVYLLINLYKQ